MIRARKCPFYYLNIVKSYSLDFNIWIDSVKK